MNRQEYIKPIINQILIQNEKDTAIYRFIEHVIETGFNKIKVSDLYKLFLDVEPLGNNISIKTFSQILQKAGFIKVKRKDAMYFTNIKFQDC